MSSNVDGFYVLPDHSYWILNTVLDTGDKNRHFVLFLIMH